MDRRDWAGGGGETKATQTEGNKPCVQHTVRSVCTRGIYGRHEFITLLHMKRLNSDRLQLDYSNLIVICSSCNKVLSASNKFTAKEQLHILLLNTLWNVLKEEQSI